MSARTRLWSESAVARVQSSTLEESTRTSRSFEPRTKTWSGDQPFVFAVDSFSSRGQPLIVTGSGSESRPSVLFTGGRESVKPRARIDLYAGARGPSEGRSAS